MTVLIIDDESAIRELMQVVLRRKGHQAYAAGTSSQAEEVWREHRDQIEVVVCDAHLGLEVGMDLCWKFRGEKPNVRIIVCSGMAYQSIDDEFEILPKPFTPAQFIEVIENRAGLDGQDGQRLD